MKQEALFTAENLFPNAEAVNAEAAADVAAAADAVITPAVADASPKKAAKPAKAKPVKPSNAELDKKAKVEAAAIVYKGESGESYELAKDADPKALKVAAAAAIKALSAIGKKDADLLKHYLSLGQFQSEASKLFKSSKLYGLFLAKEMPASQELDAALRSNCKWVYEALNVAGSDGSDILVILGVNQIEDYKSKNPTVIKRDYKSLKKEAELNAMAQEAGKSVEELEAEANAVAEAEAEAAADKLKSLIAEFVKNALAKENKAEAEADLLDVLNEVFLGKKKEAIEMLNSLAE
jgi:DNA-binding transcriptional regulator YhcF (GntR family)